MYVALTILKAAVIIFGIVLVSVKTLKSKNEDKVWVAFKMIGIVFLILIVISAIEVAIAISSK